MNNNNQGREFGWNDTIENDSEFTLLPEGDYPFMVTNFERGRHGGSAKLPPCNKAILEINVTSEDDEVNIKHNLFLHSKCEGFLCSFFTAIGQRKKGEKLQMDWNDVPGSTGMCHVIVDEYTGNDGKKRKSNKIKYFLDPEEIKTENNTKNTKPPSKPLPFDDDSEAPF